MNRISTGVPGLDEVLYGGWLPSRAYVVTGGLGTGKTTVGLHFLAAGLEAGESTLMISFDEPEDQIRAEAQALGLNFQRAAFLDLTPEADTFREMHTYDIFSPAEVERDPITRLISERLEDVRPQRVFIDAFSQFRHLANDPFHFRRLVQSCFRFVTQSGATLLVSCDGAERGKDRDIQLTADGVLMLEATDTLRRVRVAKFRGSAFLSGPHLLRLTEHGMVVSPTAA